GDLKTQPSTTEAISTFVEIVALASLSTVGESSPGSPLDTPEVSESVTGLSRTISTTKEVETLDIKDSKGRARQINASLFTDRTVLAPLRSAGLDLLLELFETDHLLPQLEASGGILILTTLLWALQGEELTQVVTLLRKVVTKTESDLGNQCAKAGAPVYLTSILVTSDDMEARLQAAECLSMLCGSSEEMQDRTLELLWEYNNLETLFAGTQREIVASEGEDML
ncbi:hypothetical protein KIPB_009113, partial [Kipferlia bialata]